MITNFARFKGYDGEWSKWYDVQSKEFKTIIKHLNWSCIESVEFRQ